jgi:hypothetical protein
VCARLAGYCVFARLARLLGTWSIAVAVAPLFPVPHAYAVVLQPQAVASVAPPALVGAVSRKVHGAAGTFDLALSLDPAAPTVEPRQGASTTIVFSFDKPVTAATAAVTEGTASVLGSAIAGHDVVVELGGVAIQQWVTLLVSDVSSADGGGGGAGAVRIGFLRGDVSGNRVVTVSDLAQVNAQIAQVVGAGNFLRDVNASGTLTVADKGIANTQITRATPALGNQAPAVSAGADQSVTLPANATLSGTASDDGLPNGSSLGVAWTKVSGPGTVTFSSPGNAGTSAGFSAAGNYVLRLLASDGALVAGDEVQVTVHPQGGTLNAPLPVLETSRAVSATIGSAGGSLTATAANGTTYRLDIPQGALPGPVTITMAPVASVSGLPLSGGLLGAVDLRPTGLRLARTALLRIGKSGAPPGGLTLTGFGLATGAAAVTRSPAVARIGEVAVLLTHFSTHGAAFGTTEDLSTLELEGRDRTESEGTAFEEAVVTVLFRAPLYTPEEIRAAYLRYFDEVVLPMLQRAATDIELLDAAAEYADWIFFGTYIDGTPAFDAFVAAVDSNFFATLFPRKTNWELLAVTKFRAAIDANNALCRTEQSLAALRNVLFLQFVAAIWVSPDLLSANGLDRPAVLNNLCAKLLITQLSLTDPLQTTVPSDMDATFGLQFDGQVEVQAVPVRVEFGGSNVNFSKTSPSNSNVLGGFTVGVSAQNAAQTVTFTVRGCMSLFGEVSDVCVLEEVERNKTAAPLPRFWAGTIQLAMTWQLLSSSNYGNQTINYDRTLNASATVDVELPPGQSVVLPLTSVGGSAAASVATTIIEEQWHFVDGMYCRYRLTGNSYESASGSVETFAGLSMNLNASGTYEIGASGVVAQASVVGTSTRGSAFTPLPNNNGVVCSNLNTPPPETESWSEFVVVGSSELPQVFHAIQAGQLQGTQSVTRNLSIGDPGGYAYQVGSQTVTLTWSLAPK